MNWKKLLKYTAIVFAILMIVSYFYMARLGKQMYGGLTKRVDHEQFQPLKGSFAIQNVNVLSADGTEMLPEHTVIIEKGRITSIDTTSQVPAGANTIDGTGKYLIPGLVDTHVHLFQSPNDLLLYLANGVTHIRELIGEKAHLEWKKEIEKGRIGPQMFVASPRIGSFEALEGWFMSFSQGYMNVRDAGEARKKVKRLHEQGYDGIKIYSQVNRESYLAILEIAKELGMPVTGHIPWALDLDDIWTNGQSDIAHFEELMNALSREFSESRNIGSFYGREEAFLDYVIERSEALATQLKTHNITVTTTLWLTESFAKQPFELDRVLREVALEYENPGISEWVSFIPQGLGWLPEVNRYKLPEGQTPEDRAASKLYWEAYAKACQLLARNLSQSGVTFLAGTDANLPPTVPGFSLHDELISLQNAGMAPAEVLKAATINPAHWLKSNSGVMGPGYDANLLLLDENPLEDIAHTKTINKVIARGEVFDRQLLDDILAAVREANDKSRKVNIDQYRQ